ncbi:glycosyl hydrolase [Micromonospora sp. AMSO31t]|uniref:glycosyl hydrolase n=1 Tax=Micromonospora sp. AMSO31t TaxID=2650566 RepID=UPI001CED6ECA|nr:glycosyl hydrolase [Micromonospora sp. AMSO31t]
MATILATVVPAHAEPGEDEGEEAGPRGIKPYAAQEASARLAPYGAVAPGEYGDALADLRGLPGTRSLWTEVTDKPYDADDPNYRDPNFSNSGGGAGLVAGRITGLAAGRGQVFAGGANGGVFRKKLTSGAWTPISDGILALSTGDLVYDSHADTLWYATGEANTGATSYTGAGVYRLRNASRARGFSQADRVGGDELESRSINQLKFDGAGHVYAATTRGLWRHSTDERRHAQRWELVFMPNPASDSDITKPYDNIINDVLIDPGSRGHTVLANAAWRSGAAYNGYYLSTAAGTAGSFSRVNLLGDIDNDDVGNAEFAVSGDGHSYYLVQESPEQLIEGEPSVLKGAYRSTGGILGPWRRIATSTKLADSGSALKSLPTYQPGVQAWYNNFIEVDPSDPRHVYLGLEEVYESEDGGDSWKTVGPYWNFYFPCFDITDPTGGCPPTTHSDQHSIAISGGRVLVGNDGGVYSRPLAPAASREDADGHALDWSNHNAGLRTLQYYSVGTGRDPDRRGVTVAGGLQDNGGSLLRAGARRMVSPFGGDGGDTIVNPRNGCQILDEYTNLVLWLTKNCGRSDGTFSAVFDVTVPDVNARFTAPFKAIRGSKNTRDGSSERWVAGGNSVWRHDLAFAYTPEEAAAEEANGWQKLYTLDEDGARLVVGLDGVADPKAPADAARDTYLAAWCGEANCNSAGFTRGVATNWGGNWTELDLTGLPNRYPNAVTFDPADPTNSTIYLVFNGFNRRFIEGPGAGVKHVYRGKLTKTHAGVSVAWTDLSVGFPDVPATDVLVVGNKLVVATDLGVLVADRRATPETIRWRRVGREPGDGPRALPLTAVFDLHLSIDGNLYAATHGRGIWKTPVALL